MAQQGTGPDPTQQLREENQRLRDMIRELQDSQQQQKRPEQDGDTMERILAAQKEVDGYRDKVQCMLAPEHRETIDRMTAEIVQLRDRCAGYHEAFKEAQRKLGRLRDLYVNKVLPRLQQEALSESCKDFEVNGHHTFPPRGKMEKDPLNSSNASSTLRTKATKLSSRRSKTHLPTSLSSPVPKSKGQGAAPKRQERHLV
eukprot:Sspe_Gene.96944::Locus_70574_Transcript_2_5_Confidence_0.429_Length_875::g.96944::m.96944